MSVLDNLRDRVRQRLRDAALAALVIACAVIACAVIVWAAWTKYPT